MKISSKRTGGLVLAWGLGLLMVLSPAGAARAGIATVEFASGPSFSQATNPLQLEESFSMAGLGSGHALIDIPTGELKGSITSDQTPSNTFEMVETVEDTWRFRGIAPGTPVTVRLTADGKGLFPAPTVADPNIFGLVGINFGATGSPQDPHSASYTTSPGLGGIQVAPDVLFPIHLESTANFVMPSGGRVDYFVSFVLRGAGGASFNFESTVRLSVDLPPGGSVTSDGGYHQAAAVPEPPTLTLAGLGVLGLAGFGWRRRKQRT